MNHDFPTHQLAQVMASEEYWQQKMNVKASPSKISVLKMEDYSQIFFELGFREQSVHTKVYGHIMDSREGVVEWVKGTLLNHFKSRLTEPDYAEFLSEYRARLFKELKDQRPYFYPFKRLLMWGQLGPVSGSSRE